MRKSRSFTLAEVLIALVILTSSIYVLSGLQFRAGRKVLFSSDEVERVFFVKKQLYNLYLNPPKKDKPLKITVEDPDIVITAHKREIDKKKSSLKGLEKDIDIIWTTGEWTRGLRTNEIKMISFTKKIKKDKKKEKVKKDKK